MPESSSGETSWLCSGHQRIPRDGPMIDASILDEISRRLGTMLPPGLADAKEDFERNARAAVQGSLSKLDLVTREEFDVQTAVLARTRERLEELEKRLDEMTSEAG